MSRAEGVADPTRPPRVLGAVRAAASDFFYNSWRLVPANALVAGTAVGIVLLAAVVGLGAALIALPLLAFPVAGLFRLAALIARGRDAVLSDVWSVWPLAWRPILVFGLALTAAVVVLGTNLVVGIANGGGLSLWIAVMSGWGLLIAWPLALVGWTVLMDPDREGVPAGDRLRLAGLLLLAHPVRLLAFGGAVVAFLLVSTVLFAAVLTVSLALAALVTARYILPAADRLATRSGVAPSSATPD